MNTVGSHIQEGLLLSFLIFFLQEKQEEALPEAEAAAAAVEEARGNVSLQ